MMSVNRQEIYSAEDLLQPSMPSKLVELVDGELVRMTPADHFHNVLAFRIQRLFTDFAERQGNLEVGYSDEGFLVGRNPDTLLCPDAALFRKRQLQKRAWLDFGPELVVEILSPSNRAGEMVFKRERFFAAGTEQFWVVGPEHRTIQVHHRDGRLKTSAGEETLEGEGVAAGLCISLPELFREQ